MIFDADGTLLDTSYLHTITWWRTFRDTGHDQSTMADLHQMIGVASA